MSQSPFYLEHYLDSLETLPGELRRNFTKMTDKDQVLKKDLVQIDSTSDEYLRKVRDLSPTKRKAEMEKIQVSGCDVGWLLCWWIMVLLLIGLSRGLPGSQESQRGIYISHRWHCQCFSQVHISLNWWLLDQFCDGTCSPVPDHASLESFQASSLL